MSNHHDPRNLGRFGQTSTPSPFYSIANEFIPRNFHDVVKWSRFIMTQSPTTAEVIRKFATYPITEFEVNTENPGTRKKYKEIMKSIRLKQSASDAGFNYYTIGNDFLSVYFPIIRSLVCPVCKHSMECTQALRSKTVKWKNFQFTGTCVKCQSQNRQMKVVDTRSTSIEDMNLISWPAEHMAVNHNPVSGASEYWYNIPNSVKRRVTMGDPTFIATLPMEMIQAIKNKQSFLFDSDNIYHVKSLNMGNVLEGLGMPPIISLYSSIFHQTLLKRANEAIATEHMTPMRVVYPNQAASTGDPISMMSLGGFVGNMEEAFKRYKHDPNHLVISPVPVGYQNIGGQGRALLVSQELQFTEETILMGLGVSRELLSGTTNWTSSTVGLRLLENTLMNFTTEVNEMANWVMGKIAGYLNIEKVTVELSPFQLTDDNSLKQAAPQLMEAGLASPSTTLGAFGLDLSTELEKIRKDAVLMAVSSADKNDEVRTARFMKTKELNDGAEDDTGIKETRQQAFSYASRIINTQDAQDRANMLFVLKSQDTAMYEQVDTLLDEYTEMIRKQTGQKIEDPDDKGAETKDVSVDNIDADGDSRKAPPAIDPEKVKQQTEGGK